MQALTEIKPGEICTIKWMTAGAKIVEWMEEHNIKEGSRITVRLKGIRLCRLHKTLVNALEGVLLKAVNEDRAIISLPVLGTNQEPESFLNEWALLLDKFSPVNIFLMRNS